MRIQLVELREIIRSIISEAWNDRREFTPAPDDELVGYLDAKKNRWDVTRLAIYCDDEKKLTIAMLEKTETSPWKLVYRDYAKVSTDMAGNLSVSSAMPIIKSMLKSSIFELHSKSETDFVWEGISEKGLDVKGRNFRSAVIECLSKKGLYDKNTPYKVG